MLLGNRNGTFQPRRNFDAAGPNSLVVADLNGDKKMDLAVANQLDDSVCLLMGRGNGSFRGALSFDVGTEPSALAVADIDKDGKRDLVVANRGSNSVSVLRGKGNGTFTGAEILAAPGGPSALALADLNGDGKLDLVLTAVKQRRGAGLAAGVVFWSVVGHEVVDATDDSNDAATEQAKRFPLR